jgi:predicted nucleic acid-binding protein
VNVVSDTSPIYYLLQIGSVDILPALFGGIRIPQAVRDELAHPGAGPSVRRWIASPPDWLTVHVVAIEPAPDLVRLHQGEREAILLAASLEADLLLLDEKRGRQAAQERGIAVTGLLGVLDLAAERGLLALPEVVESLRRSSFRVEPRLLKLLLERKLHEGRAPLAVDAADTGTGGDHDA